jgi:hypothetical protein
MAARPKTFQGQIVHDLPVDYYACIGEIITVWSYIEWEAHEIMYVLLGINPKVGRIAVAEPRATDQLRRVRQVLSLGDTAYDDEWLGALIKSTETLKETRDAFGHGIWMAHPKNSTLNLRRTKNNHPETKLPQKLWPSAEPWEPDSMRRQINDFRECATSIRRFREHLRGALSTSHGKQQPLFVEPQTLGTATLQEPLDPPPSSQE